MLTNIAMIKTWHVSAGFAVTGRTCGGAPCHPTFELSDSGHHHGGIRCAAARISTIAPGQLFPTRKLRSDSSIMTGYKMSWVRGAATVVPNLLRSAVAVLGMALLIVLSVRDLPISYDD